MKRDERLKYLASRLYDLATLEREVKGDREKARDEFFKLANDEFKEKDWALPVKTVEVPESFFEQTGLTYADFCKSRFPGWEVEHVEKDIAEGTVVFVFKRDPSFMTYSATFQDDDGGEVRVSRIISEYTPDIDWTTLIQERPDLFTRLADEKVHYEINEDELQKLIEEEPDVLAVLQRHMKVKTPVKKVTSRKMEKKDDD